MLGGATVHPTPGPGQKRCRNPAASSPAELTSEGSHDAGHDPQNETHSEPFKVIPALSKRARTPLAQ